jgi:hypothetical protein
MIKRVIATLTLLLISLGSDIRAQSPLTSGDLETALATGSHARVIVTLQSPPEGVTVGIQLQDIAQTQAAVLNRLPAAEFQLAHRYKTLPGLAGEVTAAGLETLRRQPEVETIALDLPVEATLTESRLLIKAEQVWQSFGLDGTGVNVALLDTGVDVTHLDLADRIIAQHCFNRNQCPPEDANEGNNAQDEHGHGSHIAGIIASQGQASPRGIAPGAGLVVVRVLGPNGLGFISDVLAGLDWVIANQSELEARIINLSLGWGSYTGICDQADANTRLFAAAVEQARREGITIFAASGNSGLPDHMLAPACIAGVVSVGGVYDTSFSTITLGGICTDTNTVADQVACISNSSSALDLLAPGVTINSTALGGGQITRSGTSMATAHAAAVAALMLQADPNLTPDEIESILVETGAPITDRRNGRVTPRLDALAAVTRIIGEPEQTTLSGVILLQGRSNHSDAQIFLSEATCPISQPSNPSLVTNVEGHFEITAPAGQTYGCLQVVKTGYLAAQKISPQGNLGVTTLPGGDVTGDNVVDIFDLTLIASNYSTTDPLTDINADGQVNIIDLVIMASNYGRRGPIEIGAEP